jgi:hypothetical protein
MSTCIPLPCLPPSPALYIPHSPSNLFLLTHNHYVNFKLTSNFSTLNYFHNTNNDFTFNMKFTTTFLLAAMAALTMAAPQDAEAPTNLLTGAAVEPTTAAVGNVLDGADCQGCEEFFNRCTRSAWCWFNPRCTYTCSVDTCRSNPDCKNHCRWGDYC